VVNKQLGPATKELNLKLGARIVPAHEAHKVGVGDLVCNLLGLPQEIDKQMAEVVGHHGGEMELQAVEARCLGEVVVVAAVAAGDVGLETRPVELFD
jgi:hypothetical protein